MEILQNYYTENLESISCNLNIFYMITTAKETANLITEWTYKHLVYFYTR